LFAAGYFIRRRVTGLPEFNLRIEKAELDASSCEWLPEESRKEIEQIPLQLSNLNLLSGDVLARVYHRLKSNVWVDEVKSVEKVFPDRIKFLLSIRRPVAWISLNNRDYLTDSEGVRLPFQTRDNISVRHLPVIKGLPSGTRVPAPGETWGSMKLENGLCVAQYLLSEPELLMKETGSIESIDVSDARSGGRGVVLVTDTKQRVEWGRTSISGNLQLVSDSEKLANLRLILYGECSLDDRSYFLLWTPKPTAGPPEQSARNPR